MDPIKCPACGASWIGDEIPDGLMSTGRYATRADAETAAASYGWTTENKMCFKREIAIYDRNLDCTVSYKCPDCNVDTPRDAKFITSVRI